MSRTYRDITWINAFRSHKAEYWWQNNVSAVNWNYWETVDPFTGKKGRGWHENTVKYRYLKKRIRRGGVDIIKGELIEMENYDEIV